jgi:spermidine synthase
VRRLTLAFGATVEAVAVVTGVFLAGLGVGAWLGGRWADRRPAGAVRAFAACEAGVAAWGLATMPVLGWLGDVGLGGAAPGADGWLVPTVATHLARIGVTVVLLGPPTLAMGAGLPLLVRATEGEPGRRVGLLAAANTGGAVLAALVVDAWMVPALGVRAAAGVAACAGVAAAGVAAFLRRPSPPTPLPASRGEGSPALSRFHLALFLSGLAAMGLEILWFRFLGSALGAYRAVFGVLLAVLLTGWATGAAVGGILPRPRLAFAVAQGSVGALALAGLLAHDPRALLVRQLADPSPAGQVWANLVTVAIVVLPAALAMGAALPLASALAVDRAEHAGARVGGLWLANTVGNAAGAVGTGLVLLPALGMQHTAALLAGLAGLAATIVSPRAAVAIVPALAFLLVAPDRLVWATFPHGRARDEGVVELREGRRETILVTGSEEGPARLWTNGHPMSSTLPSAQRYMRLLAHLPLLAQESPRSALVICFGVGNTLHAASLHPLTSLRLADTSADVLAVAPRFAHANRGVLADPRLTVHVDDGRHVLHALPPGSLDLVTLEPPPIAYAGVASLYTREFYALARERLAPGGWLTQWLPAYQAPAPVVDALVAAFADVFPGAVVLVGDGRELILAGVKDGVPTLRDVERRLRERPAVAEDLARVGIADARDLAALYAGPALARGEPMTDDRPVLEAGAISQVQVTRLPDGLVTTEGWEAFGGVEPDGEAYASEEFRRFSNVP